MQFALAETNVSAFFVLYCKMPMIVLFPFMAKKGLTTKTQRAQRRQKEKKQIGDVSQYVLPSVMYSILFSSQNLFIIVLSL